MIWEFSNYYLMGVAFGLGVANAILIAAPVLKYFGTLRNLTTRKD